MSTVIFESQFFISLNCPTVRGSPQVVNVVEYNPSKPYLTPAVSGCRDGHLRIHRPLRRSRGRVAHASVRIVPWTFEDWKTVWSQKSDKAPRRYEIVQWSRGCTTKGSKFPKWLISKKTREIFEFFEVYSRMIIDNIYNIHINTSPA